MKIVAAIGMAAALIALFVVALNMESEPKIEPIAPQDRVKPQAIGAGQAAGSKDRDFRTETIQDTPFDAITRVDSGEVDQAADDVLDDSLIIGVELGGQARAYPLSMLSGYENSVINDELGGTKISVTWDDTCRVAAVFSRKSKNFELLLQRAGLHYRDSMLLIDESDSLWSQLTGECKRGALSGNRLKQIPAIVCTWSSWKSLFPKTTIIALEKSEKANDNLGSEMFKDTNNSLVGIVGFRSQKGYRRIHLYEHPVINDEIDAKRIVLFSDSESHAVRVFEANIESLKLNFEIQNGVVKDLETGSSWDSNSGSCIDGKLKGEQLTPFPTVTCLASKWREINRDSKMWSPRELKRN